LPAVPDRSGRRATAAGPHGRGLPVSASEDAAVRPVAAPSTTAIAASAVLLDVDFTLLRPHDLFSAEGYRVTGARFDLHLDVARWNEAERRAYEAVKARRAARGNAHDDGVYATIAEAIVTAMGGDDGERVARCAAAIVAAWGRCQNFSLYDDVRPCLTRLRAAGLTVGLVSNTSRDLDEVVGSFHLEGLVDGAVTSSQVGLAKPAPEIFAAALACVGATAREAVMVGDSYGDDVAGALAAGLAGAVLLDRAGRQASAPGRARRAAPVIRSLQELPALLGLA
jgi:HAD superfamily hydrolase (TIGR01549 family)